MYFEVYKAYSDDLINQMVKQYTGRVAYKIDFTVVYYVAMSFMCNLGDVIIKEKRLTFKKEASVFKDFCS